MALRYVMTLLAAVFVVGAFAQTTPPLGSQGSAASAPTVSASAPGINPASSLASATSGSQQTTVPTIPVGATVTLVREPSSGLFGSVLNWVEGVLRVIAYVVGGAWVYFNYFKGRTHKPRLEVQITCAPINSETPTLLKIVARAKNAGLSKVDINDEGTAVVLKVFDLDEEGGKWSEVRGYPVFTDDHKWIEPGITIQDELLITTSPHAGYQAELNVLSNEVMWVTRTVTGPLERK